MSKQIDRRKLIKLGAATGLAIGTGRVGFAEDKKKPFRMAVVGTGNRGRYLLSLALRDKNVEVPALCDIREPNLKQAQDIVAEARGKQPEGYLKGPKDYLRMLNRDDLDAIIIGTGMQLHAPVAIAAMKAGKHVLSEVSGAITVDECWGLVRTVQETGKIYMLSENCSYWPEVMMVQNMVDRGVFGELTYAECGYVHDCRFLMFTPDGNLTWRGEMGRDWPGNNYPTHSLGPVADWFGVNRGDRLVSLVTSATGGNPALMDYIDKHLPKDCPARKIKFKANDSSTTLIKTANGGLIDLRFDIHSPRPTAGPYYALQGVKASYDSTLGEMVWIEGRTKGHKWEPIANYKKEFEHPLWTKLIDKARGTGHGGGDFFVIHQFIEAVEKGVSPIDVYDSATWSSIMELSARSLAEGSSVVEIPDFTEGKWKIRKRRTV
ncbi:MAG: Gfo/Idh/MocA family oxidoreductase [Pirellulales bacterium]|nr:Gfo/Idh/MocA family oxidoreductase [Pirellulales bacterium]